MTPYKLATDILARQANEQGVAYLSRKQAAFLRDLCAKNIVPGYGMGGPEAPIGRVWGDNGFWSIRVDDGVLNFKIFFNGAGQLFYDHAIDADGQLKPEYRI